METDGTLWYSVFRLVRVPLLFCGFARQTGKVEIYMASRSCPLLPEISVEWEKISGISRVERKAGGLMFDVTVGEVLATFTVTFPKLGGVRIRANDGFFACDDTHMVTYTADGELKAGELTATFSEDKEKVFVLEVHNAKGDTVFCVNGDTFTLGFADGACKKVLFSAPFTDGEVLYGLGERYNGINQVGRVSNLWNLDTAHGRDVRETYQNIPLLHSTAGYSVFFNSMYGGTAEFGVNTPYVYTFDFNGPILDAFFFVGTPAENLDSYTQLTGRPFLPPKWAYQYWMGACWACWKIVGEGTYAEKFQRFVDGYAEMGIHHIAAVYGEGISRYADSYEIADKYGIRMFHWNHPSLRNGMETLEKMGITDIDDPQAPVIHMPDKESDAMRCDGIEKWIDFTHPRALEALKHEYDYLIDFGIKGAMVDFGEYVHGDALFYNGKVGNDMHNEYSYWYAKTMYDLFHDFCGDEHALFMRSGCAGTQKFIMQFGGDQFCDFRGLKQAFIGGLNAGASGYANWGSDIGGLGGVPSDELYIRWLQYCTFNPLMRAHAANKHRNPWEYGETAVEVFKKLYWWRENMLSYVYNLGVEANKCGLPMMRAMPLAFPADKAMEQVDDAFMFGGELMVAPVLDSGHGTINERAIRFPAGSWIDLWTGETVVGGRKLERKVPLDTVPVYLRAGAAMVLTVPTDTFGICENMEDRALATVLMVTPAEEKREVTHYEDRDTAYTFITEKGEGKVAVTNADAMALGGVLVNGCEAIRVVADGKEVAFEVAENKTIIKLPAGFKTVEIF